MDLFKTFEKLLTTRYKLVTKLIGDDIENLYLNPQKLATYQTYIKPLDNKLIAVSNRVSVEQGLGTKFTTINEVFSNFGIQDWYKFNKLKESYHKNGKEL